jgi:hypothetical protein
MPECPQQWVLRRGNHSRADVLFGAGLSATRGVGVEEILLELLRLLGGEDYFRQLSDAGVHAVHDFACAYLALQKIAALIDSNDGVRMHFDGMTVAGNSRQILDLQ